MYVAISCNHGIKHCVHLLNLTNWWCCHGYNRQLVMCLMGFPITWTKLGNIPTYVFEGMITNIADRDTMQQ